MCKVYIMYTLRAIPMAINAIYDVFNIIMTTLRIIVCSKCWTTAAQLGENHHEARSWRSSWL